VIEQATANSIRKSITVDVPQERAFEVFTSGFASWWPLDTHHIAEKDAETAVMEPRAGGRWYERAADGSECEWGTVIAFDPPDSVVLGWQLDGDFKYDPDLVTEVEVSFIPEGESRTRVVLEHRDLDRFGDRRDAVTTAFDAPGGWGGLLERFARALG
jgi:uncharacterized protein YndB with AHSA1/START domain